MSFAPHYTVEEPPDDEDDNHSDMSDNTQSANSCDFVNQFYNNSDVCMEDIFSKDVKDIEGCGNRMYDSRVRYKVGEGDKVWVWGFGRMICLTIISSVGDSHLRGFINYSDVDLSEYYCSVCGTKFFQSGTSGTEVSEPILDDSNILYCCYGDFFENKCDSDYHVHKRCLSDIVKPKKCNCPLREDFYHLGRIVTIHRNQIRQLFDDEVSFNLGKFERDS